MMVKSGLEKIFLKLLHAQAIFYQMNLPHRKDQKYEVSEKNDMVCAWKSFQKKSCDMIKETLSHKFHPFSILTG